MQSTERISSHPGWAEQHGGENRDSLFTSLTRPHEHRLFRIGLPGVDSELADVETVEGVEKVGSDYSFAVRIASDHLWDRSAWLGAPVSLAVALEPQPRVVHGIIFSIEDVEHPTALTCLRLTLRSPLAVVAISCHQRVWRNLTGAETARRVLNELLPANTPVLVELQGDYSEQAMFVQGQESDLEFVQRILSGEGLFLLVRQLQSSAAVVISDSLPGSNSGELVLNYLPQSGQVRLSGDTILRLRSWTELKPRQVAVGGYDPQLPAQSQTAVARSSAVSAAVDALAARDIPQVERFGECGGGRQAHENLAQVYQRAYDALSAGVEIATERSLAPGQLIHVADYHDEAVNGMYFVISVVHQGDQAAAIRGGEGAGKPSYLCQAQLLSAAQEYAELPKSRLFASGLMVAELEGEQHNQAFVDGEGAYRARLAMDQGESAPGQATPPVRALQPYGGKGYGLHWPMLPRTKVALAGLDGDIERPVMLGALGNQHQPLPANAANPDQHVLRTPAGHELVFDDREGSESLRLSAAQQAGELSMEAGWEGDGKRVVLRSPQGAMQLSSGGNLNLTCGADRRVEVAADCQTEVGGDYLINVAQGDLRWRAGADMRFSTERGDICWNAASGSMFFDAGQSLSLSSGDAMRLKSRQGDAALIAEAGHLQIGAQGDIEIISTGDGEIAIGSGFGVRLGSSGEIVIEGESITLEAGKIVLQANEINEN